MSKLFHTICDIVAGCPFWKQSDYLFAKFSHFIIIFYLYIFFVSDLTVNPTVILFFVLPEGAPSSSNILTLTQWGRKVKQRVRSFIAFLDSCMSSEYIQSSGRVKANFPHIPQNNVWTADRDALCACFSAKWYFIQSKFFVPNDSCYFFLCYLSSLRDDRLLNSRI